MKDNMRGEKERWGVRTEKRKNMQEAVCQDCCLSHPKINTDTAHTYSEYYNT